VVLLAADRVGAAVVCDPGRFGGVTTGWRSFAARQLGVPSHEVGYDDVTGGEPMVHLEWLIRQYNVTDPEQAEMCRRAFSNLISASVLAEEARLLIAAAAKTDAPQLAAVHGSSPSARWPTDLGVTESLPWTATHSLDVSASDGHRYAKSNGTGIDGNFMSLTRQIDMPNVTAIRPHGGTGQVPCPPSGIP
jgi:hypothetical protein